LDHLYRLPDENSVDISWTVSTLIQSVEEMWFMELSSLMMPLGVVSYGLMLFAVLTGVRVIKLKVKHHKLIAFIALLCASVHLALVIYYNYL